LPARYRPVAVMVLPTDATLVGDAILDTSADHRVNARRLRAVTGVPPMATSEQLLAALGEEKASPDVSMAPQNS